MNEHAGGAALILSFALAVGMFCQALARHLRLPGIVLLLAAGVLLGPDGADVVRPGELGDMLSILVGFAVAIILFEGGLNLDLNRLRHEAVSIRRLVTLGALVTWAGGTVAARLCLGWSWTLSILFGSLIIVTGPTVVQPLLRRIRVKKNVATVLEAEGVLIDAVGAILAVVALEVTVGSSGHVGHALTDIASRLGLGVIFGTIAGALIAFLLRFRPLVPEGLENVFTLSLVLVAFHASNHLLPESGLMTVTVAGVVVGNIRTKALGLLKEFKEQLTVMLIGLLFVLLAADVRLDDVRSLGFAGLATVLAVMFIVRPLNILSCTVGSGLGWREKTFLSWIGPRGIVAAAVASLFATQLDAAGIEGGAALRALVFSVIAATVLVQGLTGGMVAGWLGLRRGNDEGYVILGANPFAIAVGERLAEASGEEVVFLDSNPQLTGMAEQAGHRVLFGNALSEPLQRRAELESRAGVLSLTPNVELNLMFADRARNEHKAPRAWSALRRDHAGITPEQLSGADVRVLFGEPRALERWAQWWSRKEVDTERWRMATEPPEDGEDTRPSSENLVLPVLRHRGKDFKIVDESTRYRAGDEVTVFLPRNRREEAHRLLTERGWVPAPNAAPAG